VMLIDAGLKLSHELSAAPPLPPPHELSNASNASNASTGNLRK
jgi:hypothetical protein